jgi:hypothetical protein
VPVFRDEDDVRDVEWWPINPEHYADACRLLAQLALDDDELHDLTHWSSVPLEVDAGRSRKGHGARRIDYDQLHRELERLTST